MGRSLRRAGRGETRTVRLSRWMRGTGRDAQPGVICSNPAEVGKHSGEKAPTHWKDLPTPRDKGELVMPDPAWSGTGYLMVGARLQMGGDAEEWKFMDALHENIAVDT